MMKFKVPFVRPELEPHFWPSAHVFFGVASVMVPLAQAFPEQA